MNIIDAPANAFAHTHTPALMHKYTHIRIYVYICAYIQRYNYMRAHIHTYKHTYIYTHATREQKGTSIWNPGELVPLLTKMRPSSQASACNPPRGASAGITPRVRNQARPLYKEPALKMALPTRGQLESANTRHDCTKNISMCTLLLRRVSDKYRLLKTLARTSWKIHNGRTVAYN